MGRNHAAVATVQDAAKQASVLRVEAAENHLHLIIVAAVAEQEGHKRKTKA